MITDLGQQRLKPLLATALAWLLMLPIAPVQAQTEQGQAAAFEPSAAQIEHVITMILLCDWSIIDQPRSPEEVELRAAIRHLELQQDAQSISPQDRDIGTLPGSYDALGLRFDHVGMMGMAGGFVAFGWSAAASPDGLVDTLRGLGYDFKQGDGVRDGPIDNFIAARITPAATTRIIVAPGRHNMRGKEGAHGATIMCHLGATTDEAAMAAAGVPSTATVTEIVLKGEKQPEAWIANIIDKAIPAQLRAIARYRWLDAAQVETLLALNDIETNQNLASNLHVSLDARQIDGVLETGAAMQVIRSRYASLSEAQRERLKATPHTALALALRGGGAEALAAFESVLREQHSGKTQWALNILPNITEEIVNVLLEHGSAEARSQFVMQSRIQYTPQQLERMLRDDEPEVQIGVLRRHDLPLTAEQFARGINHPDERIAFWYRQRKDHVPTAKEIEKGLTSTNVVTRRGWVFNQRITLTAEQAARALADADPVVRRAALMRPEVPFGPLEQDACTDDPDFGVRSKCVSRPDYTLTQARFESIASHPNPNVLRAFLSRKDAPTVALDSYIESAIRNAPDATLIAMAANKSVPLTDAHIQMVRELREKPVMDAFCKRSSRRCR